MKTDFISDILRGDAIMEDIDEYVARWHQSKVDVALHEFLGMTWDEYSLWVENPAALRSIVYAHQFNHVIDQNEWTEVHLLAARSQGQADSQILLKWLKRKGLL